ncbi:peptide transporter family 1-like, partial [Centruroides sculpturatus]|uniref:peptide transporter family 1-like n=1 Tax=Centruroides sculpturatus TaxID=218467 RepID=UPI000C6DAD3D
ILILYLTQELLYSENTGTNIYHAFSMTTFFLTLFGAILADTFLGKFRTILYGFIFDVIGCIVISLSSVPNFLPMRSLTIISLVVIAFGIGGTRPCIPSFGGDQFKTNQITELRRFFSFYVISCRMGMLTSSFLIPFLRETPLLRFKKPVLEK